MGVGSHNKPTMNAELFWEYWETPAVKEYGGFPAFSLPHILWLLFLAAGIMLFAVIYKRCGERGRDNMRKCTALFLVFFEIFKQCLMALKGAPNHSNLPIEICSFAEYTILLDALWPKNRVFKPVLTFAFLPSAVMALVFPTVTVYPPISFYAIHQFLIHAVIVAYIIARYAADEIRPRYRHVWLGLLSVLMLIFPVYCIDRRFHENFMFLTFHENNPALKFVWDLTGGEGGFAYIAGMTVLVLLVMHAVFVLFTLIGRNQREKKQKR